LTAAKCAKVFVISLVPFLVFRNLKFSLTTLLKTFATAAFWLRQLLLLGMTYLFCHELPLLAESPPCERLGVMLAALSGAKTFLVGTALGVTLTMAGAAVTTGFFELRAASLLLCRLRLRTPWKPSS
jgi:hypothetical protein